VSCDRTEGKKITQLQTVPADSMMRDDAICFALLIPSLPPPVEDTLLVLQLLCVGLQQVQVSYNCVAEEDNHAYMITHHFSTSCYISFHISISAFYRLSLEAFMTEENQVTKEGNTINT
jgi:hypothetical protein